MVAFHAKEIEDRGIRFEANLDIPEKLACDQTDLAIVISNLLENSLNASEAIPRDIAGGEEARFIRFSAQSDNRLLMSIENPVRGTVEFDGEGNPLPKVEGHGLGTRSVLAFAERNHALVDYRIRDDVFIVRIIV